MSGAIIAASLIGALATTASSIYSTKKTTKATIKAAEMQQQSADKALAQQYAEMNAQNQKKADIEGILEQNTNSEDTATLLTGALGLDKKKLTMGSGSNLLGG